MYGHDAEIPRPSLYTKYYRTLYIVLCDKKQKNWENELFVISPLLVM